MILQLSTRLFLKLHVAFSRLMQNLDWISLHRRGLAEQISHPKMPAADFLLAGEGRSRTRITTRSYL